MSNQFVILSIDPGYDRIGWAVGQKSGRKIKVNAAGCIQTQKRESLTSRYQHLEAELQEIIGHHQPQVLAIEQLFFSSNKKTALKVAEARGVIIGCCLRNNMKVVEYHPNTIKLTVTGNGRADKSAIEKMVRLQLKLSQKPLLDDTIDALAILMTHAIVSS